MGEPKRDDGVLGYHWLREDRRLNYPPHTLVEPGQTLRLDDGETPKLCDRGFHASVRALDALSYAPGPIVCRVRLSGVIVRGDDKLVASERTVLWMADATDVLHEVACQYAEDALRVANVDDPRCHAAIDAKRRWLRGEITDAELAAAWAAARAAAWDAAKAAACDAARAAAWAAARAAACDAAWDAARAAAWDAAWDAARAAAWAAAWDAARARYNGLLEAELSKLAPEVFRG